ncbi:MAG: assimilatory sulfite reductase (NADPH) flavoprotein subunit [Kurthia sp.]|nr:assimilatory sulfite reductase (NADPH) flavoprotein subunit [Candidatus Kurthia equi]
MTLKVINSPFTDSQIKLLNELLPGLTLQQKNWLSGYLAAVPTQNEAVVEGITVETATEPNKTLTATVLYGSQTGNAKSLAVQFANELTQNNVEVEVTSLADFPTKKLKKVENLLIITSTQGEGDAPDNAKSFLDFLHSPRVPNLESLNYSVLALGDTSYDLFCQTGIDFDERLAQLGAKPITPRVNCDLDFQDDAEKWFTETQQALLKQSAVGATIAKQSTTASPTSIYSRKNPFYAEVLEKINLNMTGSNKATYHVELSLEGSGIQFSAGDSLGIFPTNNKELVDAILKELNIDENQKVQLNGQQVTIGHALTHELEITVLTKPLFEKLGETEVPDSEWRDGRDLLDAIKEYEFSIDAQQLADSLRKLPPRLYSIASSYDANPEEVHLTIGLVTYEIEGRSYEGVTSGLIANEIEIGDKLPIFIQENDHFRLPADEEKIIMIGAGTGVAPFRSFIEQREETGATGESWLFFGEQHFVTDFLYQLEWQRYLKAGVLSKMSVAFSRDQEEKIYVQHRILEQGQEFYNWIQQGATIFICGDEKHMAKDVEAAILQVIAQYGNKSEDESHDYLQNLIQEKRYLRDVY